MCASTFALFYVLNPAVILTFVYPAQIIVIYTSVTAYLFATTIIIFCQHYQAQQTP